MPDAKFESGSVSSFGDMISPNFPLKTGNESSNSYIYPRKMGLTLKELVFMSRIVLLDPKLTPCQFQQFSSRGKNFSLKRKLK